MSILDPEVIRSVRMVRSRVPMFRKYGDIELAIFLARKVNHFKSATEALRFITRGKETPK